MDERTLAILSILKLVTNDIEKGKGFVLEANIEQGVREFRDNGTFVRFEPTGEIEFYIKYRKEDG